MRTILCGTLASLLSIAAAGIAATKVENPDTEMLKLMESLQQWDIIKDLELMRDFSRIEADGAAMGSTKK